MRISVTDVESFRLFLTEDWMTEDRFLTGLLTRTPPTDPQRIGNAFETMVRTGTPAADGFTVDLVDLVQMRALLPVDVGVWQVKAWKDYQGVTVVGKADLVHGGHIYDLKTKTTTVDLEAYLQSYQWRFYLDLFGASVFGYAVAKLAAQDDGELVIQGLDIAHQFRYPQVSKDCAGLVRRFVDYLYDRRLADHPVFAGTPAA